MRRFWVSHAVLPAAVFYDWHLRRWVGANSWWAVDLIDTGGRDLARAVALASLAANSGRRCHTGFCDRTGCDGTKYARFTAKVTSVAERQLGVTSQIRTIRLYRPSC